MSDRFVYVIDCDTKTLTRMPASEAPADRPYTWERAGAPDLRASGYSGTKGVLHRGDALCSWDLREYRVVGLASGVTYEIPYKEPTPEDEARAQRAVDEWEVRGATVSVLEIGPRAEGFPTRRYEMPMPPSAAAALEPS